MSFSYTLPVPSTPAQMRALAATIERETINRARRIQLRFGTCLMLPPTTAEEAQFPGTVSAAYALEMLSASSPPTPKPKKPDGPPIQLMSTLVSNIRQEQTSLQMFVDTLSAHPGNFIKPDVFVHSILQIQENLDRLTACVRELPRRPWGTVKPEWLAAPAAPPPPRQRYTPL